MKKYVGKRFLSMLLAVVMVVSMLPVSVLASGTTDQIEGAVSSVLDGMDFYYNDKVGVSMNFGGEVDPNGLLADEYDIKAVGAVKLTTTEDELHADGEVYLYVPYSVFEAAYDTAVEQAMVEMFDNSVTTALTQVYSQDVVLYETTKTVMGASVTAKATITLSGTLAQIIESLLNYDYVHTATITYTASNESYQDSVNKVVASDSTNYPTSLEITRATLTSYGIKPATILTNIAIKAFELVGVTTGASHVKAATTWASTAVSAYDAAVNAGTGAGDVIDAQTKQLATVIVCMGIAQNYTLIAVPSPIDGNTFKSAATIRSELKEVIWNYVVNAIDGDVQSFYGELIEFEDFPEYNETLTSRFEALEDAIDKLVSSVSALLGKTVSFDIPLPIDKISVMEGMLKTVVSTLNGTNAEDEFINGAILGYNDTDTLTTQTQTGIYIVAGVNSANTSDMALQAHVIAPELVEVQIQSDEDGSGSNYGYTDKGIFMQSTVGQAYTIKSSVDSTYTDGGYTPSEANLMQLRIDGLTTKGERYAASSETGAAELTAPANAGVYTVLSIYLDKATLAMGADIAVLVVEPAKTTDKEFAFEDDLTVTYDGNGHYPNVENNLGHATIKGAVNTDQQAAYILYPVGTGEVVGTIGDTAADILEDLNDKAQGLHLPTAGLTNHALDALEKLTAYAENKVADGADGGILTGTEVKTYLNKYLTALKGWYSHDNLETMSSAAYKAALDAIAQIEQTAENFVVNNPTIAEYTALIGTMMDAFEALTGEANQTETASTYTLRAAAVETTTVEEVAASTATTDTEQVKLLAEKVVNTLLAKAGVTEANVMATVQTVLDYASGVNINDAEEYVINSKYYDDAVTLVKTMGAAVGAGETTMNTALAAVKAAFLQMYSGILGDCKAMLKAHGLTGVDAIDTMEEIMAQIDSLTKAEIKTLAAQVLHEVETFVSAVMDAAKAVIDNTDVAIDTVYFNIEPSEVGTYSCYAVNVNPNYIPNLTRATLEIIQPVTITVLDQTIGFGGSIDGTKYTVTDTVTGKAITVDGLTVTLSLVEEVDTNTANTYENVIRATYEITGDTKYDVTIVDENAGDDDNYANLTVSNCAHPADKVTSEVTAPTCTEDGYTTYTCECGHSWTDDKVDATGHTYTLIVTAPTCTERGYTTYTCHCGHSYKSNYVDATGHSYESVVTAPTCTEQGYTTHTCSACSDTYTDTYVDANGHTEVIDAAVAATCTATGLTEGKHCSVCDEVIVAQTVVDALGHEDTSGDNKCDRDGCGAVMCTEGNHIAVTDPAVAATCTTDGKTEGSRCSACGEVIVAQEVIPASGHDEITIPGKAATCTETGLTDGTKCATCKEILTAQETIKELGHIETLLVENKVDATCTVDGSYTEIVYCTRCKTEVSRKSVTISAQGHTPSEPEIEGSTATCTTPGSYFCVVYCSVCDEEISRTKVENAVLGHKWDDGVITTPATCTKEGVLTKTCTREGCTAITTEVIDAGHKEVTIPGKTATCTEYGLTAGAKCSVCGEVTVKQTVIPAKGHTYNDVYTIEKEVPAGCGVGMEGSFDCVQYCATPGCTEELFRQTCTIPLIAHVDQTKLDSDKHKVEGQDGICDVCGVEMCTKKEEHGWIDLPAKDAGCVEPGLTEGKYCPVCKQVTVVQKMTSATGHTWDEGVILEGDEARCCYPGAITYTCLTDPNHIRKEVIPATGHCVDENGDNECDDCEQVIECSHTTTQRVKENVTSWSCYRNESYNYATYCTECHMRLSREETIIVTPMRRHHEDIAENDGMGDGYCDDCGANTCIHDWEMTGETKATCYSWATKTYTCQSKCGRTRTDYLEIEQHTLAATWTATETSHYRVCMVEECGAHVHKRNHNFILSSASNVWYCGPSEGYNSSACGYQKKVWPDEFLVADIPEAYASKYSTVDDFTEFMFTMLNEAVDSTTDLTATKNNNVLWNFELENYDDYGNVVTLNDGKFEQVSTEDDSTSSETEGGVTEETGGVVEDADAGLATASEETVVAVQHDITVSVKELGFHSAIVENPENYVFHVYHLFSDGANGEGESPEVTLENGYLSFTLNGLSPVDVLAECETERSHVYDGDTCILCGEGETSEELEPAIIDRGITLLLKGITYINQYIAFENFDGLSQEDILANGGLLIWNNDNLPDDVSDAVYGTQSYIAQLEYSGPYQGYEEYKAKTNGIPAKELGDTMYVRPYVVIDGEYFYGDVAERSVQLYCEGRFANSSDKELKSALVALLNYGSAAQVYFDYKTDVLANANVGNFGLDTSYMDLNWEDSYLTPVADADATMIENFAVSKLITDNGKTLFLKGAISVCYYMGIDESIVENSKGVYYFWTVEDYEAIKTAGNVLTKENASYTVDAELGYSSKYGYEYSAQSEPFVAKEFGKTVYACLCVTDSNANDYYSGVMAYSPEEFAAGKINDGTVAKIDDVMKWMVVYGERASIYLNKE